MTSDSKPEKHFTFYGGMTSSDFMDKDQIFDFTASFILVRKEYTILNKSDQPNLVNISFVNVKSVDASIIIGGYLQLTQLDMFPGLHVKEVNFFAGEGPVPTELIKYYV